MRAIVFAVIAGLCWGVGEIFTKSALNTGRVGPFTILLLRSLVTVVPAAIVAWYAVSVIKSEPADFATKMGPGVWAGVICGTGLLAGFAGVFFFYWGLGSPGGDISLIRPIAFALSPLTAVILGWMVLGEPMTLRKGVAVVLIVVGISLLAGEKSHGKAKEQAALRGVPLEANGLAVADGAVKSPAGDAGDLRSPS